MFEADSRSAFMRPYFKSAASAFGAGDNVLFNEMGSGSPSVTIGFALTVVALEIDGVQNYRVCASRGFGLGQRCRDSLFGISERRSSYGRSPTGRDPCGFGPAT